MQHNWILKWQGETSNIHMQMHRRWGVIGRDQKGKESERERNQEDFRVKKILTTHDWKWNWSIFTLTSMSYVCICTHTSHVYVYVHMHTRSNLNVCAGSVSAALGLVLYAFHVVFVFAWAWASDVILVLCVCVLFVCLLVLLFVLMVVSELVAQCLWIVPCVWEWGLKVRCLCLLYVWRVSALSFVVLYVQLTVLLPSTWCCVFDAFCPCLFSLCFISFLFLVSMWWLCEICHFAWSVVCLCFCVYMEGYLWGAWL